MVLYRINIWMVMALLLMVVAACLSVLLYRQKIDLDRKSHYISEIKKRDAILGRWTFSLDGDASYIRLINHHGATYEYESRKSGIYEILTKIGGGEEKKISNGEFIRRLVSFRKWNPKPHILVRFDGDIGERDFMGMLDEVGRKFDCDTASCFYHKSFWARGR